MNKQQEKKLSQIIEDAEQLWLKQSSDFVQNVFQQDFLPSHDLAHHLRTWNNAKRILFELDFLGNTADPATVEAVLLSTLFHDTGLTKTRDSKHGASSKEVFSTFLKAQTGAMPALLDEILDAIEFHDQKEIDNFVPFSLSDTPDILTITCMADDMDALGTIGIYRYAEIYLLRETSLQRLGIKVLQNVSIRMNKLSKAAGLLPELTLKNRDNYQELVSFYDRYNQQLLLDMDHENINNGHIGVINCIRECCLDKNIKPDEIINSDLQEYSGDFLENFFSKLRNEILTIGIK